MSLLKKVKLLRSRRSTEESTEDTEDVITEEWEDTEEDTEGDGREDMLVSLENGELIRRDIWEKPSTLPNSEDGRRSMARDTAKKWEDGWDTREDCIEEDWDTSEERSDGWRRSMERTGRRSGDTNLESGRLEWRREPSEEEDGSREWRPSTRRSSERTGRESGTPESADSEHTRDAEDTAEEDVLEESTTEDTDTEDTTRNTTRNESSDGWNYNI